MKIGSLFSGAGALDRAVLDVFGGDIAWHCENDTAANKVLRHHWPRTPNLGDIDRVDWGCVDLVDILCGGFPCTDVSAAGRHAGIRDGTRSGLWARMTDAIAGLQPDLVIIENVKGLLNARAHRDMERNDPIVGDNPDGFVLRAAGAVFGDLADLGYDAAWTTMAASDIGACHERQRIFVIAAPANAFGRRWLLGQPQPEARAGRRDAAVPLLPTPNSTRVSTRIDTRLSGDGRPTPNKLGWAVGDLLPTPRGRDYKGATASRSGDNKHDLPSALLPTPAAADAERGPDFARADREGSGGDDLVTICARATRRRGSDWGRYAPAIDRWEQLTRPAPSPSEPNTKGNPRLAAPFSEWMMGWPAGWVTAVNGITRNEQLAIIGNGVVTQQATAAIRYLLNVMEAAA